MHIYFSDLRRVLTHSKIDRMWIIYFITHKMFAYFKWSKPIAIEPIFFKFVTVIVAKLKL